MSKQTPPYSYRCGKRVSLKKNNQQFVARMSAGELKAMGYTHVERVSPSSSRVTLAEKDLEHSMGTCRHYAPTHHAYYREESNEEFLITDRIFVTFQPDTVANEVDLFAGKYGLVKRQKYNDTDYLFQLTDHTGMNPVKLVVKLTEEEEQCVMVEHDLNWRVKKYAYSPPVDPFFDRQWHLHDRSTSPEFDERSSANVEAAWRLLDGFGSPDVVVGITDDGCLLSHPDFDSGNKFVSWGYFEGSRLIVDGDFDAQPDKMYQLGANHGTSVAGVVAGEVDATFTVGAAPGCRMLPIKWESNGPNLNLSESKLMTAINFLSDKVDIMSNSWGITPISEWSSQLLNLIRQEAISGGRRGKGLLFLWAAGNENVPINHNSDIPLPFTSGWEFRSDGSRAWVGVQTTRLFRNNLVGIPGVMHIAALASTAQRSHYSNFGTGIDLTAPSSNVHTYQRLSVDGLGIFTAIGQGNGVTSQFGGTSSATPLVAGVAALVLTANPSLTALEVVSLLRRSASKSLNTIPYAKTPPASFDPDTSWDIAPATPFDDGDFTDIGSEDGTWSPWFGYGKLDAAEAIALALKDIAGGQEEEDTFEKSSTPKLAIPDDDPAGVRDVLNCPNQGALLSVKVDVDISHTYIGDLMVVLRAPSGKQVVLHDRAGGGTRDLKSRYEIQEFSALSALVGEEVSGDWTILIADFASQDVGTLNYWKLDLKIDTTEKIRLSERPGVTIPDNDPEGISRSLEIGQTGKVGNIEVKLDLTHTYIGDLTVALIAPDQTTVLLHNRTGRDNQNIIRKYNSGSTPELANLIGKEFEGTWQLRVIDGASRDVGKLNMWELKVVPA